MLLEQKSIGYVYPCEVPAKDGKSNDNSTVDCDDWQIVVPVNDGNDDYSKKELRDTDNAIEPDGNENYGEWMLFGLNYHLPLQYLIEFLGLIFHSNRFSFRCFIVI